MTCFLQCWLKLKSYTAIVCFNSKVSVCFLSESFSTVHTKSSLQNWKDHVRYEIYYIIYGKLIRFARSKTFVTYFHALVCPKIKNFRMIFEIVAASYPEFIVFVQFSLHCHFLYFP